MLRLLLFVVLAQTSGPAPSFSQTVLRDFEAWDANRDGALSVDEIDRAALNPGFHDEDAAALAALHVWLHADKDAAPRLTRDWFASYLPVRLRIPRGTPADVAKSERKAYTASPGSLQSAYVRALRRLEKSESNTLFVGDGPHLSDVRQGALGDCYMLAPLGAMIHRDPNDVRRMIRPDGTGYLVAFGDGKTVHVAGPTDAELAMGGASTNDGLWIRIVEKAYGSRSFDDSDAPRLSRDTMNGGRPSVAGRGFTGHRFTSLPLIGDYRKEIDEADLQTRLVKLRQAIPATLADHRLVLAATAHKETPKSINGGHAYAVFDYDPATDRITLWNPHGDNFTPQGPEGVENGYARTGGVFSMPLTDFAHAFSRIFFEAASPR